MSYADQWKALSARIVGLHRAGELHLQSLQIRSSDTFNQAAQLREQCESVLTELQRFRDTYAHLLPTAATHCIEQFIVWVPETLNREFRKF